LEFSRSLTEYKRQLTLEEILKSNPRASARGISSATRAAMLKAGLAAQEKKSRDDMDLSLSSSQAGTVKDMGLLSPSAEPKSNAYASVEWESAQSLSAEERAIAYDEARTANPGVSAKDLALAYRIALLKAGVKKAGINLGGNLGEVALSLFSGTDAKGNSREESDSSEDRTKALRDDLERQNQVSLPSSPIQNEFLNGLMKSLVKR
jgi:hypothetical protein